MELHSTNVVQVAEESEEATPQFIVPHLNLVVIPSRDEERLRLMEMDAPNGTFMLIESVNECAHSIIPQLDDTTVQAG
jgi:hypothetical protein